MKQLLFSKNIFSFKKNLSLFIILLFSTLIACNKYTPVQDNKSNTFFEYSGNSALVIKTIQQLKTLNNKTPFTDSLTTINSLKWDDYLKSININTDINNNYSIMVPFVNKQNVLEGYIDISVTKAGIISTPIIYNYTFDYLNNHDVLQKNTIGSSLQFFSQKNIILPQSFMTQQTVNKEQIATVLKPGVIKQTFSKAISSKSTSLTAASTCNFTYLIGYDTGLDIIYENDNQLPAQINRQYLILLQANYPPGTGVHFSIGTDGLNISGPAEVAQGITAGILTQILLQVNGVQSVNSAHLITGSCTIPGGGPTSHSVNISNLPAWGADLTQSYDGSCTFMNMEIVGDILGTDVTEDGLISAYATAHNESVDYVRENGIPVTTTDYSTMNNFFSQFFNEVSISTSDITSSINLGRPVMAFVVTGVDINTAQILGHEITVYSYTTDNNGNTTYNYIDTSNGTSKSSNGSGFGDPVSIYKK